MGRLDGRRRTSPWTWVFFVGIFGGGLAGWLLGRTTAYPDTFSFLGAYAFSALGLALATAAWVVARIMALVRGPRVEDGDGPPRD